MARNGKEAGSKAPFRDQEITFADCVESVEGSLISAVVLPDELPTSYVVVLGKSSMDNSLLVPTVDFTVSPVEGTNILTFTKGVSCLYSVYVLDLAGASVIMSSPLRKEG